MGTEQPLLTVRTGNNRDAKFPPPARDPHLQSPPASRSQRTQSQFHFRETLEATQLKHWATWVPGQLVKQDPAPLVFGL